MNIRSNRAGKRTSSQFIRGLIDHKNSLIWAENEKESTEKIRMDLYRIPAATVKHLFKLQISTLDKDCRDIRNILLFGILEIKVWEKSKGTLRLSTSRKRNSFLILKFSTFIVIKVKYVSECDEKTLGIMNRFVLFLFLLFFFDISVIRKKNRAFTDKFFAETQTGVHTSI